MPKKKPAKSGYFQFFLECRDKQAAKGGKLMSHEELQAYAGKKWAAMKKDERAPYDNLARAARESFMNTTSKLTTDGLEVDELERQEKEVRKKEQEMKSEITRSLKAAHFDSCLDQKVFFIVHINHLTFCNTTEKYYICELAVAAMTLKDGIKEVFHEIVQPGELPKGYLGGAMAHSKETHQLLDILNEDEDNTHGVFQRLIKFLKKYTVEPDDPPVLYADEKTIEMTRSVIDNFCYEFRYPKEIKIYSLPYMLFALRNVVAGHSIWPSETFGHSELARDVYSYTVNISCDYHETADITVHCSKSIVTRTCYTICDHCCQDLRIVLIPGVHVPANSKIVTDSRATSNATSLCSGDGFRSVRRSTLNSAASNSSLDDGFRPVRSTNSTASSVISFSSMKSRSTAAKTAERLEHSFKSLSLKDAVRRDHNHTNFPQHGSKRQGN